MDLKSLIPTAPLLLRPILSHVVERFERQEATVRALVDEVIAQRQLVQMLTAQVQSLSATKH